MPLNLETAIKNTEKALIDGQVFFGHGTDNPWDEAVFLTLGACNFPLDSGSDVLQTELNQKQQDKLAHWLHQRIEQRKPLAYLLGYTWFAGIQFAVSDEVIIPRSPMAELIVTDFAPFLEVQPQTALDLCCGSGCIGIAIALQMQVPHVDMVDISPAAISLAQKNIAAYELQDQVRVYDSNLFSGLPQGMRYDLIVSNPPYVDASDFASMPEEFGHEPELALVSGSDGLDITASLLAQAADWLSEDGLLVIEVGNSEVHLQQQLPEVPFIWLELANGGNGIFCLTAEQCRYWQSCFQEWEKSRLC